jgi:hypothetical protein
MDNLDEVLRAIAVLTQSPAPQLRAEAVTVSTSGVVPGMRRFLAESRSSLALSLNATTDAVRERVIERLMELGESDPARAFKEPANHPTLRAKDGREIPIHSVRIRRYDVTTPVGEGARERQVMLGSNHHIEIVKVTDAKGGVRWEGKVVSLYEALRRLRAHEPVVQRDHGPGKTFVFSLARGETIQIDGEHGTGESYVVEKVTKRGEGDRERCTVGIVRLNDARKSDKRELMEPSAEVLHKKNFEKVVITPLGEIRRAHD